MITVSKEQVDTVEYLLAQSAQGNHILFDTELVREVFSCAPHAMNEEQAYEVEHHIERILSLEGFDKQKAYLDLLSQDVLYRVIKTYFNIVENNLFETAKVVQ